MKLCVIGAGYVGLVASTCFANSGNTVHGVDVDDAKIQMLGKGESPIYAPGLSDMLRNNVEKGRLRFTTDLAEGVTHADVIIIAVGTPEKEDGSADLQYVLAVAADIARYMNGPKTIVNKSTVPVGTADRVRETIAAGTSHTFTVISNPEFLKQGTAVNDFLHPDRVIIGSDNEQAAHILEDLYRPFVRKRERFVLMDNRSAELTKYAANAMLATRISFINDLAILAEKVGADIEMIRRGIGSDSRIGLSFLYPGVGYGGSCFPKDIRAIQQTGLDHGHELQLIGAVDRVNRNQRTHMIRKVFDALDNQLVGRNIAIWGLSFKPGTDDLRDAPALDLIRAFTGNGAHVHAYDPVAMANAADRLNDCHNLSFGNGPYDVLQQADALVICTEWMEFREPDFERISAMMNRKLIVDGRNMYDPGRMRALSFDYRCIGRPC